MCLFGGIHELRGVWIKITYRHASADSARFGTSRFHGANGDPLPGTSRRFRAALARSGSKAHSAHTAILFSGQVGVSGSYFRSTDLAALRRFKGYLGAD